MYSLWLLIVPGEDNHENVPYSLCLEFFYQSHIGLLQDHGCNSGPRSIFVLSPEISTKPGLKKQQFPKIGGVMKVISYRQGRIPQIGTPQKKSLKRIPDIREIFNRSALLLPVPLVIRNRNHKKIPSFNRNIS